MGVICGNYKSTSKVSAVFQNTNSFVCFAIVMKGNNLEHHNADSKSKSTVNYLFYRTTMTTTKEQPQASAATRLTLETSDSSTDWVTSREGDDELLLGLGNSYSSDDMDSFCVDEGKGESQPVTATTTVVPRSRRSGQNYNLQVVEEGKAMEAGKNAGQRWSCPPSCPFAEKGRHGLGCTMIHEDFDFEACNLSEREYSNRHLKKKKKYNDNKDKEDGDEGTQDCTISSNEGPTKDRKEAASDTEADRKLRRRRLAQVLLMIFLTLGTIILLLVLVIPSSILRDKGGGTGDFNGTMGQEEDLAWNKLD